MSTKLHWLVRLVDKRGASTRKRNGLFSSSKSAVEQNRNTAEWPSLFPLPPFSPMSVACRCTFLDSSSSDDLKLAEGLSEDLEKSEIECISNYIELYQSYSFHVSCVGPLACSMSQLTHQQHHCRATTNGGSGAVGHTASSLITIRQQQKLSRLLSLPMPCAHRYSGIPEQGICLPFTLHSTSVVLPTFVPHSHIPTRSSGQVHKSNPFPIHLSVLPTHSNGRCRWSRRPPRASQPASHQD